MDLKTIHKQLKNLHDKIKKQGHMSTSDQQELQSLMNETINTASYEMTNIQTRMGLKMSATTTRPLNAEQIARLSIVEKTGTGSNRIH